MMDSRQIMEAMRRRQPVRYDGIEYRYITRYSIRTDGNGGFIKDITLQDKAANAVVVVRAEGVELIDE